MQEWDLFPDVAFVRPLLPGCRLSPWGGSLAWPLVGDPTRAPGSPSALASGRRGQRRSSRKKASGGTEAEPVQYTAVAYAAPATAVDVHVYTNYYGARPYLRLSLPLQCTFGDVRDQAVRQYLLQGNPSAARGEFSSKFLSAMDFVLYRGYAGLSGITPWLDDSGRPQRLPENLLVVEHMQEPFLIVLDQAPVPKLMAQEKVLRLTLQKEHLEAAQDVFRECLQKLLRARLQEHLRTLRGDAEGLLRLWTQQKAVLDAEEESRGALDRAQDIERAVFERQKRRQGMVVP
eukprot:RCo023888